MRRSEQLGSGACCVRSRIRENPEAVAIRLDSCESSDTAAVTLPLLAAASLALLGLGRIAIFRGTIEDCTANGPFGHSRAGGNRDGLAEALDSRLRGNDVRHELSVSFAAQSSIKTQLAL